MDAGNDAGHVPETEEMEPNNAATMPPDVNAVPVPARITGAINPADDLDVFSVSATAGELWTWRLEAVDGTFAPHLAIVEENNETPVLVAIGTTGSAVEQPHFVLRTGTYFVIVRDSRNVPSSGSAHVGGPQHTWALTATRTTPQPTNVQIPSTVQGTLASPSALDFYRFEGTRGAGFDIVLRAERLTPPSELDSRLTLVDLTTQTWLITNDDDVSAGTIDSKVGGELPSDGAYLVIVDNVAPEAAQRQYALEFSWR